MAANDASGQGLQSALNLRSAAPTRRGQYVELDLELSLRALDCCQGRVRQGDQNELTMFLYYHMQVVDGPMHYFKLTLVTVATPHRHHHAFS